jgi:hypothetical protein
MYTQPRQFRDDLGNIQTIYPQVPGFIQEAADAIGIKTPATDTGLQDIEDEDIPPDRTIFGMNRAGTLTGPWAAVKPGIGRFPPTSGLVEGGGAEATNQKEVSFRSKRLVGVFKQSTHFNFKEYQSIIDELDMTASFIDSGEAYERRTIGLDRALRGMAKDASDTAMGAVSAKERKHAADVFNGIMKFLPYLGVPREVKSRDEVWKLIEEGALRPGDNFVLPNGSVATVPDNPQRSGEAP